MELLTDETFVVLDCAPPSCQIRLEAACDASTTYDCFIVEIRGSIPGCGTPQLANVEISIEDITDGVAHIRPVLTQGQGHVDGTPIPFLSLTTLGTLSPQGIHLEQWTVLTRIRADWLLLARSGRRSLLFHIHILTGPGSQILTSAKSVIDYQNQTSGYIEIREHLQALRLGATALALAAAGVDRHPTTTQFNVIRQWITRGLPLERVPFWLRWKFCFALKAMAQVVSRANPRLQGLCQHIVRTTPCAQRYDILNLCIQVVAARNSVSQCELAFIKQLGVWFELDAERIRMAMEKALPVNHLEGLDLPSFLGITAGMTRQERREHLNREYVKWNARVTHADPAIQSQAEQMLDLIAQARSQYADSGLDDSMRQTIRD